MKHSISLLAVALSSLFVISCPGPSSTDPVTSASPSASVSATVAPSAKVSSTPSQTPSVTVTPVQGSTPAPITTINPNPATNLEIKDSYHLTINGQPLTYTGNKVLAERYEANSTEKARMVISSFGIETVSDAKYNYSFKLTLTTDNALIKNFDQNDYNKVNVELRRINKVTNETETFVGETVTGANKSIPTNRTGNTSDMAGKTSSVIFESNNNRYSGYVDTYLAQVPNQAGQRTAPLQHVRIGFEQPLTSPIR